MGPILRRLVVLTVLPLVFAGCASAQRVNMSGYLDKSRPSGIPSEASFFVAPNTAAPNPLLDQDVKRRIEAVLSARGYRLAPENEATYKMIYQYDLTARTETQTFPEFSAGPDIVHVVSAGGNKSYTVVSPRYSYSRYDTRTKTLYTSRVLLKVEETGGQKPPAWIGEAMVENYSPDLRESIDSLLAGVFRVFGTDTGRSVSTTVKADDPDLKVLSAATAADPASRSGASTAQSGA